MGYRSNSPKKCIYKHNNCPNGREMGQAMNTTKHWTVVADGQDTGVYADNYDTALALADEYAEHHQSVQIVEVK